jgi:hypothetical protein
MIKLGFGKVWLNQVVENKELALFIDIRAKDKRFMTD